jgi:hypothetical protein
MVFWSLDPPRHSPRCVPSVWNNTCQSASPLIGSIPLLGDAFGFAYKTNLKNLRIYEHSMLDLLVAAVTLGGTEFGVIARIHRVF